MIKRKIFYSFHFNNDVMRVQQVRNIGVIEGNSPVTPNEWESIKAAGDEEVEKWIDENMNNKSCVVVLIGEETYKRKWVKKEIQKAWSKGKGLVGIYIHNLNCPNTGNCRQGENPFKQFTIDGKDLSSIIKCYNPSSYDAYNSIKNNIDTWIQEAIDIRNNYRKT